MNDFFDRLSGRITEASGSPWVFMLALGIVVIWAVSGPLLNYSNGWELLINTGTTIITFLMVFLIQASENSNSKAVQIKLDELIRATKAADNRLVDIENKPSTTVKQRKRRITKEANE